jgi:hypothetical protein
VGTACGVANFASNLAAALAQRGLEVRTVAHFETTAADVVLVQHEFGLFDTAALKSQLRDCRQPKILFCHTAGVEMFQDHVDGFLTMCPNMVRTRKPVGIMPHPGWYSGGLADRGALQRQFGYQGYACVVGSNGFVTPPRQFKNIVQRLLPLAIRENWLINLLCSRHANHNRNPSYVAEENALRSLARRSRHLRLDSSVKSYAELNLQLQACDLLWCWTDVRSSPYASGTCSDQYCSGTRQVVVDKLQHSAVRGLPNTRFVDGNLDDFLEALMGEIHARRFGRHDARVLSWDTCADIPAAFLREILQNGPATARA